MPSARHLVPPPAPPPDSASQRIIRGRRAHDSTHAQSIPPQTPFQTTAGGPLPSLSTAGGPCPHPKDDPHDHPPPSGEPRHREGTRPVRRHHQPPWIDGQKYKDRFGTA